MSGTTTMPVAPAQPEFDQYAQNYDAALQQGLSVSGEAKEFFAEGRVKFLKQRLDKLKLAPKRILDFGCGTGTSVPILREVFGAELVLGTDLSADSVAQAKHAHHHAQHQFITLTEYVSDGTFDLVFCNGVFHHIPLDQRQQAMESIFRSLKPGGVFAFWENNPWNPATRYVMSRIPFDKDAITLTPPESRQLTTQAGFQVLRTDFLFIFPRLLKWFRPLEKLVTSIPAGTQYQVLCQKPA